MSAVNLPRIERDKKRIIQKIGNVPVAVVNFDVITIEGENKVSKKIRAFYEKLFERFSRWVNNDFEKYAKRCYEADDNPRKRYRYCPIELKYLMKSEFTEEKFLIVDTEITLIKWSEAVSEKKLKHIWNLQNGNLHIQRQLNGKGTKKMKKTAQK